MFLCSKIFVTLQSSPGKVAAFAPSKENNYPERKTDFQTQQLARKLLICSAFNSFGLPRLVGKNANLKKNIYITILLLATGLQTLTLQHKSGCRKDQWRKLMK